MRWFGESWGAPACEPEWHAETPVGQLCLMCKEPVLAGHQGVLMPFFDGERATIVPEHLDCLMRSVLPHGPDCPRCCGLNRDQHEPDCGYWNGSAPACTCKWADDAYRNEHWLAAKHGGGGGA